MTLHVLLDEDLRTLDDARTDDEESGLELVLVEIVEEFRGVRGRAVIVTETPAELRRAEIEIGCEKVSEQDSWR